MHPRSLPQINSALAMLGLAVGLAVLSSLPVRSESPPTAQWLARGGGGIPDSANAVAVDAAGNVYFAGVFGSNAVFGGTALSTLDGYALYIAKLDAAGNYVWAKTVESGCPNIFPARLLVDGAGKLVLMATPSGDPDPTPALQQLLVARFEPSNGATMWTKKVRSSGFFSSVIGNVMALDASNNVYVAGSFSSVADFGNGVTLTSAGLGDAFVAKLNSNGVAQSARRFGQANAPDESAFGVAVDNSGNIWVAAHFGNTNTIGASNLVSAGETDIAIVRYDSALNVLGVRQYGSTGEDLTLGLTRDASGNVFLLGKVTGAYALGLAYPFDGYFAARLDGAANLAWATPLVFAKTLTDSHGFATDGAGNLLICAERFLAKLNTQGAVVWSRVVENNDYYDLAVTSLTNIFLAGAYDGTLSLDSLTATNAGNGDAVVVKLVLPPIVAPQITQQPTNQTVTVGANVTFLLTATGTAPLAYQWRFLPANVPGATNTVISGATNSSLALTNVQTAAAGAYSAVVANSAGSVTSSVATLTVNVVPPGISVQPTNVTVFAGSNAAFSVTATGTPPLSYQWRFNGTNLAGSTNALLSLIAVATNQAGPYTVVVSNAGGSITSQVATLTVNLIPPSIPKHPAGTNVFAGTNVAFTVMANGSPPLNYFWRRNGTNLGAPNSATLTLNNVQPANNGTYSVIVSNAANSAISSNAVLVVQTLLAAGPPFDWVVSGGGTSADEGRAVAVDADGFIYAVGRSAGPWRFGGTVITNNEQGPYLLKLDTNGAAIWVRRGVGGVSGGISEIATDGTNLFVGGSGPVVFNGITNNAGSPWIGRCDTNGTFAWIKTVGGNGISGLAADGAGGAYVAGGYQSTFIIGTNNFSNSFQDIFWARYNGGGTNVWARVGNAKGGTAPPTIPSLRTDSGGRLWAAISFSGGLNLGGAQLTNTSGIVGGYNSVQAAVARFQSDGSLLSQTVTSNAAAIQTLRMSLWGGSNAVVAGYFPAGAVGWGGQTITNATLWVGRVDGTGQFQQAAGASVGINTYPVSVAADSQGNAYVGLTANGNTNHVFGSGAAPGGPEIGRALFAKWNSSGVWEWGRADGSGQTNTVAWLRNVAVDASDHVLLVGDWAGTNRTFGTFFVTNNAPIAQEIWVGRLPASVVFRPTLSVVAAGGSTNLLVSWPASAGDWMLEMTAVLGTPFASFPYAATTNPGTGRVEVLLPATNSANFFILRQP